MSCGADLPATIPSATRAEAIQTIEPTEDWQSIRSSTHRAPVAELALVLASVGLEHHLHRIDGRWHLLVRQTRVAVASHQLAQYELENRTRPKAPAPVHVVDSGRWGVAGYVLVIWCVPFLEFLTGGGWRSHGVMHAASVLDGQWWRTVTALTLHADLGHIFANTLFGSLFGWLACRYLGSGVAWLLVVLAAACGNGLNALVQPAEFRSIGASTAVFASLGLVGTFVWRRGYLRAWGWRRSFAPVFAAIALVAYTGTGGANTDVAAHLFGFICGAGTGLAAARTNFRWLGSTGQTLAGALAVTAVASAWMLALQAQ